MIDRRRFLTATALPLTLSVASAVIPARVRAQGMMQPIAQSQPTQRVIAANGIRINIAEQGTGPLVVLCHGFPETWYSWRHQMAALAQAGFHAVAPDMRGYGMSDRPEAIDQYTIFHLVGDLIGVLDAFDTRSAVIVGHDVGASVAWQVAQLRPDRVRAVVGLSVPFRPRGEIRPTAAMPRTADAEFYMLYFQKPGLAEAEFEADPRAALRNMLYGASGDGVGAALAAAAVHGPTPNLAMVPVNGRFMRGAPAPATLPAWLTEADVDRYASAFTHSGFRGPLNYYRNLDRNWELSAPLAGARVTVPALYIGGDRDFIAASPGMDQVLANIRHSVPGLRKVQMLRGCGHWTQQERPDEVNAALLEFIRTLPA
jgi:pimeloyl-ACP methyl ester carboxylesterase